MEAKIRNVSHNEIRIGNWIQWEDDSNEQIQVNEITHITGEDYSATNYFFNGGLSLDFIPIPLTEEWLIKFGFTKHSHYEHLFFKDKFRYNINNFTVGILRDCAMEGESKKHACGYPSLTDMVSCGNVHQLQNLYWCLCGKELELKQ